MPGMCDVENHRVIRAGRLPLQLTEMAGGSLEATVSLSSLSRI